MLHVGALEICSRNIKNVVIKFQNVENLSCNAVMMQRKRKQKDRLPCCQSIGQCKLLIPRQGSWPWRSSSWSLAWLVLRFHWLGRWHNYGVWRDRRTRIGWVFHGDIRILWWSIQINRVPNWRGNGHHWNLIFSNGFYLSRFYRNYWFQPCSVKFHGQILIVKNCTIQFETTTGPASVPMLALISSSEAWDLEVETVGHWWFVLYRNCSLQQSNDHKYSHLVYVITISRGMRHVCINFDRPWR